MIDHNFKAIIEALLFVSERPVLIEQIRSVLSELDSAKVREIL
jgi:chromosome segregation and condensation protein ScpB